MEAIMEPEVSKAREIRSRIKLKVNNFMYNNDDDPFGYMKLVKFFTDHNITISPSVDGYINGYRPFKRRIIIYSHVVIEWVVILRFTILTFVGKPWIWSLLGDSFYLLGTDNLFSIMLIFIALIGASGQLDILYHEKIMDLSFVVFLQNVLDNTTEYKLEHRYYLRFCRISKLLNKWFLGVFYRAIVFIILLISIALSIKSYLDPDMDFSITSLILANVLLITWFRHCMAIIMGSFVFMSISSLYFKYEFRQIQDRIKKCIKYKISRHVIDAIYEHDYCTKHIQNFNRAFSLALFPVYFFATPLVNILLHMMIYKSINVFMCIFFGFFLSQLVFALYLYTYIASSLSAAAHDFPSYLHSFIVRNRSNIRNKLKISAFIEKLYETTIGIYCYNLFAFTTFEFYEYLAFISGNYFLLNGLLFHN